MYKQYAAIQQLEMALGSPNNQNNVFFHKTLLALDERSEYPKQQAEVLHRLNFAKNLVPKFLGGNLDTFETFVGQFRCIFRREPSLGLGYGVTSFMGSVAGMYWGNKEIQAKFAKTLINNQPISVAYHEKNHGNDILHAEVMASFIKNKYVLTGEKWVINNAIPSAGLTVFCKTGEGAAAKSYSLMYIDKAEINQSSISYLDKIKTLGIKGCHIAGINFNQTQIPATAVIGNLHNGFDLTLKAFQITRATVPGMALGIVDTALRLVLRFSLNRTLYRSSIMKFPHVNQTLVDAYINLLIADCVSTMATRSLHIIPEQMSIISSIAKFYIPKKLQSTLKELAVILGARHYVRNGEYGFFQKLLRDFPVIALGHASDVVCASTILPQLSSLLKKRKLSDNAEKNIKTIFNLSLELPEFQCEKLRLSNLGYNDILNSLASIEEKLSSSLPFEIVEQIKNALQYIQNMLRQCEETLKNTSLQIQDFSHMHYLAVEQYCQAHVAMSCCYFWLNNLGMISDYFDKGYWLVLALASINHNFVNLPKKVMNHYYQQSVDQLIFLFNENKSFSLVPIHYL